MRYAAKAAMLACLGIASAFTGSVCAIAGDTPAFTAKNLSRKTQQANLLALNAVLEVTESPYSDSDSEQQESDQNSSVDEDALIARLKDLRQQGADFSSYPHEGTVLLHAIYSRLDRTALWLVQNGANPLQTVGPGGADALDLAIRMQNWKLVEQLVRNPAMASRLTPANGTRNYFDAYSIIGGGNNRDAIDALLALHVPPPQGNDAACFLHLALEHQMLAFALALPADTPRIASKTEAPQSTSYNEQFPWRSVCDANNATNGETLAFAKLSTDAIERLDHKLANPLFPYLLASLRTPKDVERLFSLAIRKPTEAASTQEAIWRMDKAKLPADIRQAVVERLPQAYVAQAEPLAVETGPTEAEAALWITSAARKPTDQFAAAMKAVRPEILKSRERELLVYMHSVGGLKVSAANWSIFLKNIPADAFVAKMAKDGPWLLSAVPIAAWPDLFALGYRPSLDETKKWIASATTTDLRSGFPQLLAYQPEARYEALPVLTAQYANRCEAAIDKINVDKIRTLIDIGATVGEPIILHRECARLSSPVIVQSMLATGAFKPSQPLSYHHFVLDTTTCEQEPSSVLLAALNGPRELGNESPGTSETAHVERVQMLSIPGHTVCGVLASGGYSISRTSVEDGDFYSGFHTMTPCTSGDASSTVWSFEEGKLTESSPISGEIDEILAVKDLADGTPYIVVLPTSTGCGAGNTPAALLKWKIAKGQPVALEGVPSSSDVLDAFVQQCGLTHPEKCLGAPPHDDKAAPAWNAMQTPEQMADRLFANRRRAWLDAVMRLDRKDMAAIEQQGIAPHWLYAAFADISASDMSLAAKRAHVAALLRNHANIRASAAGLWNNPTDLRDLESLFDWLPDEDWPVLLDGLKEGNGVLEQIGLDAENKNRPYLACSVNLMMNVACKEAPK